MVNYNEDTLDAAFGALADPTRRAILARLAQGEARVTELAQPFGMSLPAVSKHLRVLEKAQLIQRRVEGRTHRFSMNTGRLESARSWIETYQTFWQQRLAVLETYLETPSTKEKAHGHRRRTKQ